MLESLASHRSAGRIHSADSQSINNFPIILSGQAVKIHLLLFEIDALRKLSIISQGVLFVLSHDIRALILFCRIIVAVK